MKKTFKMAVFTAVTVLGLCLLSCDIPAVLDGLGGSAKTKAPDYSSFIPKNGITQLFPVRTLMVTASTVKFIFMRMELT